MAYKLFHLSDRAHINENCMTHLLIPNDYRMNAFPAKWEKNSFHTTEKCQNDRFHDSVLFITF